MKTIIYLVCFFSALVSYAQNWESKIDDELWAIASEKENFEFFVLLKDQANTLGAKKLKTKEAKANFVFNKLQQKANETQGAIVQFLTQEKANFKPFFIVNGIWVNGNVELMELLANREEVQVLAPNPAVQMDGPREELISKNNSYRSPTVIEWGISKIKADMLWLHNLKGAGAVIGGQDTGYDWDHLALKNKYRGTSLDHNYHWHDAIHSQVGLDSINSCGYDVKSPCDDGSHGTHTMGTMVGDDNQGNQIGVAPEAKWIGCRNMDDGWGTPTTYIECFEWFLAPTDTNYLNPKPNKAPHVIANSWGCPPSEGCNPSNYYIMQMAVENLKNAGTFIAVSAGNDGWGGCNTIYNPAAIYEASFSVGATDIQDTLAGFSSLGSVLVDTSGRMKPNVVAPGRDVRSSVTGGGYATYSGTSMAGPHVAGAVALLINAAPHLAGNVDSLETLLEMTADSVYTYRNDTCGLTPQTVFPNNMVGYGRINLYKALKILRPDLINSIAKLEATDIQIYPNPFSDYIQLKTPKPMYNCTITIVDALGKSVNQFESYFVRDLELDLGNLAQGVYFIRIENKTEKVIGKVVKQ